MHTTLVLAEKPDAALCVADALSGKSKPRKISIGGVPMFEIADNTQRIVVCSALGHLYGVTTSSDEAKSHYPTWNYAWKPIYLVQQGMASQKRWIESIEKVAKEAQQFVNACDYDIEGSLIGYMILKYACKGADRKAQRMTFSTLTTKDLSEAYRKLLPALDYPLIYAGMTRHEVDWLYGINLSRALTQSAYKAAHRYVTLSTGRVQGPTLKFIVDRELDIHTFVPTPYWTLRTTVNVNGKRLQATCEVEQFAAKSEAEQVIRECIGKSGVIEKLESKNYKEWPPVPFDLSTLQGEAYRHFRFTPRFTLQIAERLYLDQLVSYPRTSSQKLPPSIGYEEVIRGLRRIGTYEADADTLLALRSLTPHEGKKQDPAHPAIYPTGMLPKGRLDPRQWKLLDLIVRRFLATFGEVAIRRSDRATIKVNNHFFFLNGSRILEQGWIPLYGSYAKFGETVLPTLNEGQEVLIDDILLEEKLTQPSPRFNPSSLLKAMEDAEIGTKATRAEIIDTLYRRGYIRGQRGIIATPLASIITELLADYCPKVIDVKFTRELETMMEQIEQGTKTREQVVLTTIDYLKPIIEDLKSREAEIGLALTSTITEIWEDGVTLKVPCPKCKETLVKITSKKRKRFIGHKTKTDCKFSLPLPPSTMADLTLTDKLCSDCGFQMIQIRWKNRSGLSRPIMSCPNCFVNRKQATTSREKAAAKPIQKI